MSGTEIAVKVTQSALFKFTPKLGSWFLNRVSPFKMEYFIILFEFIPFIYINHEQSNDELRMCVWLQNFTVYETEIFGYECDIQISSQPFMSLKNSEHFILKPNQKHKFVVTHSLGSSDLRRAEKLAAAQKIHPAYYSFSFNAKSRFGQQQINIPQLPNGIIIE